MDWFKQNPFVGAILAAAAVILLVGGYFVYTASGQFAETQEAFASKKSTLENLQRGHPFPDEANLKAAGQETEHATKLLEGISKNFEVSTPSLEPKDFQDKLSRMVLEITKAAADKGIALPEKFYLGFESYQTEPPAAAATAALGLQLDSIHAVVKALLESNVKSLGPILRTPLRGEASAAGTATENAASKASKKKTAPHASAFGMAAFDISFTADQTASRTAFNRILNINPPVFIRLAALSNSAPKAPLKAKAEDERAAHTTAESGQEAETSGIKPVFGRETVTVNLRLASITPNAP